ncbi:hypothetical protein [Extibacter muris]|uniref:hypothetical protein n=1 Tax=Extibacter muris TaxID=1796622 RepID=UPI001D09496A|nr:hypothetical protein [Extibacter muris]MCB6203604.1 hypothetical protein [Extibacter muris]MCQ4665121.1 hypothetical protein [Extibacter muris]MCQ4694486.1 hypothetical protein [Extibacter muris]
MSSLGFDVLRLIEHNRSCYVSSEFVQGRSLIQWLKYHPNIPKEQLFSWMYEIMRQLQLFHRLRGRPCYQYVNPYSIIISGEEKLYLLDAGAQSSEMLIRKMQRKAVRDNFLPQEENIYRKASIGLDIYGLGRTWQYMLSVTDPAPALTKREARRLRKIISRCLSRQSKHTYRSIEDIQKHFPICRTKPLHYKKQKKVLITVAVVIVAAAGILIRGIPFGSAKKSSEQREDVVRQMPADKSEMKGKDDSTNDLLKFDMGMVCLLELDEYAKAAGYLEEVGRYGADCYAMIARCLEKDTDDTNMSALAAALKRAEDDIPEGRERKCVHGLIKGYSLLDTEEADADIVRLGDVYLSLSDGEGGQEETDKEIMELMAVSYEEMQKKPEALSMYERILEHEEETGNREELFAKMTLLREAGGEMEKAWECCRKGMEELPDSSRLRLLYIRMQCRDTSVDRNVCAETIKASITEIPELTEMEEFKKLQREYDIQLEGEEVWVGR